MQQIEELIRNRKSWRKFSNKELNTATLKDLTNIIQSEIESPFGNKPNFELIRLKDYQSKGGIKLGTYGLISGAEYFMVGSIIENERFLEDYAFSMESKILQIVGLGLSTCWLGGTFRRSDFSKALNLSENEFIPAISPIGYQGSFGLRNYIMRSMAKSDTRKKFNEIFFVNEFNQPLEPDFNDRYFLPLEMVRLAPSGLNFQPWRILRIDDNFHFYLLIDQNKTKDKLPESPGAFTEAQLRWINGHYPEDFAAACRSRLSDIEVGRFCKSSC